MFSAEDIDFLVLNETIDVDASSDCIEVNITVVDDMIFEDNETFIVIAKFVDASLNAVATEFSSAVTILDDESKS